MYQNTSSIMQKVATRICKARCLKSQMSMKTKAVVMTRSPINTGQK